MPPIFSLQVSRTSDLATLAGYCGFGLLITGRSRRKTAQDAKPPSRSPRTRPVRQDGTCVASVFPRLLAADIGRQLSSGDIGVDLDDAVMPWAQDDTIRILSAVITDAIERSRVQRISIYAGRRPGVRRLVVTAHRTWPPPLYVAITIGKADCDCQPFGSLALPRNSRASLVRQRIRLHLSTYGRRTSRAPHVGSRRCLPEARPAKSESESTQGDESDVTTGILCSDDLHGAVEGPEIREGVSDNADLPPAKAEEARKVCRQRAKTELLGHRP
jgi:hypothetical protein